MKRLSKIFKLRFITFLVLVPSITYAQKKVQNDAVFKSIKQQDIQTINQWSGSHIQQVSSPLQVLLQFNNLPDAATKTYLKLQGIDLKDYVPGNAYIAVIDERASITALQNGQIKGIADISAETKADIYLWDQLRNRNDRVELRVSFLAGISRDIIANAVADADGTIIPGALERVQVYRIVLPVAKVKTLAAWYGTQYISPVPLDEPLNFESRTATKANWATLSQSAGGYGLNGEGITIGIGDNASGVYHIDLKDRVINYVPTGYTNHGVHISGITGGAGIGDPKAEGMASAATIVNHLYSNIWEQTEEMRASHNMSVTNNSYAAIVGDCKYAGTYDVSSKAVDEMAVRFDDVLHVFAAGNDGYLDCPPYPAGFASINGGYQPAKNIIVVTSTDKRYVNAWDGSRGPIKDGRLKPEMTAVGVNVYSTTRKEEYLTSGGTSMACPEVTGAAGLLTQRYKQINGNINPKAVVLKTLLLNGTMDIGNPGPDYRFGFGFMDLYRSLQMLDNNRYKTDDIGNGGSQTLNITVPANTAQLKVMLCWHDVPANPGSITQLVNDLDLEVQTPNSNTHLPLILDPAPANINNNAVEGVDRRNNCEQVVINDPQPGNYILTVKGFNIPSGSQFYALAYDLIPAGVMLSYPTANAAVKTEDSLRIYWDASAGTNPFTLEYTTDGSNWNQIDNNIPADQRLYVWYVPAGIGSGKCKMRLTRGGDVSESGNFAINPQPVVTVDAVQCPCYFNFNWTTIPGASGYQILQKKGGGLVQVGMANTNSYVLNGLPLDSVCYVAVRPVIDGIEGYRSLISKRQPNDGDCSGSISDGDLMVQRVVSPNSGRMFTSTALSANETLSVEVRNLDDADATNFRFSYRINNAPWQSQVFTDGIAARSTRTINIPGIDMSTIGSYNIQVAITNMAVQDNVSSNDTLAKTILQLRNDPISLTGGYMIDFENMQAVKTVKDSIGISPDGHWDYENFSDTGMFRSFVNTGITINGNRSISMDAYKNMAGNMNELNGTFNLSNYSIATDEVRMEFKYILHGIPKFADGNEVWVRGNDQQAWVPLYKYKKDYAVIGIVQSSGTLSLTDALSGSQAFTSSLQVKFGQHDTSLIAARNFGNGLTLDDVYFYTVQNDMQLLSVVSPVANNCGLSGQLPLSVLLYNSVNQTQSGVRIYFKLNDGSIVEEILPTMQGKDSLVYTFNQKIELQKGRNMLDVWVDATGDTYRRNDSILNYEIHNQPLITQFPYFEDFEASNGFWYSEGIKNSWQYGEPKSVSIHTAASGTKAWKTNLDGNYNNLEHSFLYTPCFDISGMNNPTFSCKQAIDIENCLNVLCDAAWMEYSFDGNNWTKLGAFRQGINWYTDSVFNVWNQQDFTAWHEATISLPKGNTIRMRFVFESDPGATREGIAIDDAQVYEQKFYTGTELLSVSPNPTTDGKLLLEWAAPGGTELQVTLTDLSGKNVFKASTKATQSYNRTTLQTGHYMSGVYILHVIIGEKKYARKIVYK